MTRLIPECKLRWENCTKNSKLKRTDMDSSTVDTVGTEFAQVKVGEAGVMHARKSCSSACIVLRQRDAGHRQPVRDVTPRHIHN